jgi:hypothetical protein
MHRVIRIERTHIEKRESTLRDLPDDDLFFFNNNNNNHCEFNEYYVST